MVRLAVTENLVTPHTAAVGVMLQHNPMDPAQVKRVEVPLQLPHGTKLFGGPKVQVEQEVSEEASISACVACAQGQVYISIGGLCTGSGGTRKGANVTYHVLLHVPAGRIRQWRWRTW